MKKIKMLSLFSGIGAPETAIKNLGFDLDVLNYCEIDKFASTSYSAIHNEDESKNLKDVRDVDGKDYKDVDILFHGSPCQSFSIVGKQDGGDQGSGTASSLMWETVRIVKDSLPKIVIWENVKAVLNRKHKHNFDLYIQTLEELGYQSSYKLISPRDVGEAQSRPRVFVVSTLNGKFEFPDFKKQHIKTIDKYLEDNVSEEYIVPKKIVNTLAYGNANFNGRMTILRPTDYAGCLVAKSGRAARTNNFVLYNNNDYIHMENPKDIRYLMDNDIPIRNLTPLEYWRLQNFSDEAFHEAQNALAIKYKKGVIKDTEAQLFKQAGNSINITVLESFIGEVLDNHV
ncbi:DNA (cytosine-5-)-methyltransferase [Staphylococcus haemolyticus]|uniref:DNA (cytosine-5-)-methyltransferase n=1 Tax=Staphylococcus haemolyticus TaxID=1283 RepID=UPI00187AFD8E|nr:DNA cytosine methyltransferase [Staphylococcus haemolyticus]MBE7341693.1 DNA cytosine methyltransferase [Staphylococcus haemolyticus]